MKDDGFEVDHDGLLITVFSAPNYCDQMGNKGAFIRFESDMIPHFTSFVAVPHPPSRPRSMRRRASCFSEGAILKDKNVLSKVDYCRLDIGKHA